MPSSSDQPKRPKRTPISCDLEVRSAKLGDTPVAGAPGLFLRVHLAKSGSLTRSWYVRLSSDGKRPKRGLDGSYPVVTLAAARQKAIDVHRGIDPGVRAKRRQRLAEAARTLTLAKAIDGSPSPTYKNPKSDEIRERALEQTFAPLHARDVTTITALDIASILKPLAPQTAIKAHTAIRRVFDYAATMLEPHGVPLVNPADPRRLRSVGWSPKPQSESTPHAAVHWRVVPEVVAELSAAEDAVSACALLMIATAMRAKTARLTKWANIDFARRIWTPPIADLKNGKYHKRPFIVPLSPLALDALERMRVRSSSRFAFANSGGGPITEGDITNLLRRLRRRHIDWVDPDTREPFTVHGFRASLKTWTREAEFDRKIALHIPTRELAELILEHRIGTDVEQAYDRSDLLGGRREILDLWSRHCLGAKIIAFPNVRA
jgi:integrase